MTSLIQIAVILLAAVGVDPDPGDASLGNPCADVAGTAQVNDCYTAAIKTQGDQIAAKAAALRAQIVAEEQANPTPPGTKPWSEYAENVDGLLKTYANYFDAKCNLVASGEAGGSAASNAYNACLYEEQNDLLDFLDGLTSDDDEMPQSQPLTP